MRGRRKTKSVEYGELYNILLREPLDRAKIREVTGVSNSGIMQIIDTLTLRYPLYQIRKGVYGLLKDGEDDEKTGGENRSGGEKTR
jgi:hypothetical protein